MSGLLSVLAGTTPASTPPNSGLTITPVTTPTPTVIPWDRSARINLVQWGNSHYTDSNGGGKIHTLGNYAALLAASNAACTNVAHGGWSWQRLAANTGEVDALWNSRADYNIVVVGEDANNLMGSGWDGYTPRTTVAANIADAKACLTALAATHPWIVLLCGTIPVGGTTAYTTANALRLESNQYMVSHLGEFAGVKGWCDFRTSPYFDGSGDGVRLDTTPWMGVAGLCAEGAVPYVHPLGAAKTAMSNRIAATLQTLTVPA